MFADKLQQWLLRAALIISAVLLLRFAIDFTDEMKWWLAGAFWLLVVAALGVGIASVLSRTRLDWGPVKGRTARTLLIAMIPLGFAAASLDCTGLSARGCSPFCTFIKLVWVPLMAGVCAAYFVSRKQGWLTALVAMSFVTLVPHCVCYNVGNSWWIDRIGASPVCYVWGFVVSMLAAGALRSGDRIRASLVVCLTIIGGETVFFISHHYFHFPW
ncbi:MAG: hypothetical protein WAV20_17120 [Blastocatellia bacterium]